MAAGTYLSQPINERLTMSDIAAAPVKFTVWYDYI